MHSLLIISSAVVIRRCGGLIDAIVLGGDVDRGGCWGQCLGCSGSTFGPAFPSFDCSLHCSMGELCFTFGFLIRSCWYPFGECYSTTATTCFVHRIGILAVSMIPYIKNKDTSILF